MAANDVHDQTYHEKDALSPISPAKEADVESGASLSGDSDSDVEVLNDARDLITHVISVEDDPTLNCWTFRVLVIGLGLSTFGGVLGTFKTLPLDPVL